jgi:hypothetical protein
VTSNSGWKTSTSSARTRFQFVDELTPDDIFKVVDQSAGFEDFI